MEFDEQKQRRYAREVINDLVEHQDIHSSIQQKPKKKIHISEPKMRQIKGVLLFAIAIFLLYCLLYTKLQEVPDIEGEITDVTQNGYIINRGSVDGMKDDYTLVVYEDITHYNVLKDKNETKQGKVAELKITEVSETNSEATLSEKYGDKTSDIKESLTVKTQPLKIFGWNPIRFRIDILLARFLFWLTGYISFLLPLSAGAYGVFMFSKKPLGELTKKTFLIITTAFLLTVLIGAISGYAKAGGIISQGITAALNSMISSTGTIILSITLMIITILLTTEVDLTDLKNIFRKKFEKEEENSNAIQEDFVKFEAEERYEEYKEESLESEPAEAEEDGFVKKISSKISGKKSRKKGKKDKKKSRSNGDNNGNRNTEYIFPVLSLLEKPQVFDRKKRKAKFEKNATLLEVHLSDFGISGTMIGVNPGPVITCFEFRPEAGIKISKIASLSDDLAMRMKAHPVRIIAPIPGKDAVGIEIPNPDPQTVYIRDVLDSREFSTIDSKLTFALGKDISGYPYCTDLADMPHLLIAGATGSGKSVCLNAMICSILFRATPEDVRFLMIDPKRLELNLYNEIPHLLAPTVVHPNEAIKALAWTVGEMERRYKLLAGAGVRHIDSYNEYIEQMLAEEEKKKAKKTNEKEKKKEKSPKYEKLPYIVVIVDELADLMLTSAKEIETYLMRLAQMARAVGIHLVLATQRPSVDVITGVIKANFPSRISFQVASKTDSRTILDRNGAEQLLGHGDMLFLPAWSGKPIRIHGSYVSVKEVKNLVKFIKDKNESWEEDELLSFTDLIDDEPFVAEEYHSKDGLYNKAMKIVISEQSASASLLQRKLRIGYPRAARLLDMLEEAGIVGPNQGQKQREVFVDEDYMENKDIIFGKKDED